MLNRLHQSIDRGFRYIENLAAIVAGSTILLVMALVSLDAILRRGFGRPLTFELPLSENYLLVVLVLLSLAWGYRQGGSIQVRLLTDHLPPAVANGLLRVGLGASAIYMALLAWLAWTPFHHALLHHEVTLGVIDWPVAWSWIWVPIGCGLLSIRLVLDAVAPVLPLERGKGDDEIPATPAMEHGDE